MSDSKRERKEEEEKGLPAYEPFLDAQRLLAIGDEKKTHEPWINSCQAMHIYLNELRRICALRKQEILDRGQNPQLGDKELLTLINDTEISHSVFFGEAVRLMNYGLFESVGKSSKESFDLFAKSMAHLTNYIKTPSPDTGQSLMQSALDLDKDQNVSRHALGTFLKVVGAGLFVAGILGMSIMMLAGPGLGVPAAAAIVKSVGTYMLGAGASEGLVLTAGNLMLNGGGALTALLGIGMHYFGGVLKKWNFDPYGLAENLKESKKPKARSDSVPKTLHDIVKTGQKHVAATQRDPDAKGGPRRS